jgi:predicted outer membrane repeat protein
MTFGIVMSPDGGHTWAWICEAAVPYSGIFDPSFLDEPGGDIFATTLQGLEVTRDGCAFTPVPVAKGTCDGPKIDPCYDKVFFSNLVAGSGSAIYATASSPYDSKIYRSGDGGHTFAMLSSPGASDEYWQSLVIAPSNSKRFYLAGYRFAKHCDAHSTNAGSDCVMNSSCGGSGTGSAMPKCTTVKLLQMFRSDDAGATWSALAQDGVQASPESAISIIGVDPRDANQIYIRVSLESGGGGDGVYKSRDGGAAWTKIFDARDPRGLAVLVRSTGELVAATESSGAFSSPGGAGCTDQASCAWKPLASAPHITCLTEQPTTHDVWACTRDASDDRAGIMKTSDLARWSPVLRYADIAAPVACGSDTPLTRQCVAPSQSMPSPWCCLKDQLGITANPIACTGAYACTQAEPTKKPAPAPAVAKPKAGCCDAGGDPSGALLVGALTLLLSRANRSRRRPCRSPSRG